MPHLVVDVSGHGFGHMAQVAPVLECLAERVPDLRITLRTRVATAIWRARLRVRCAVAPAPPEPVLAMRSAMDVAVAPSLRAYHALHRDWPAAVAEAGRVLRALEPDLLLADVGYLSLAAATAIDVPALALSSLNWADVLAAYAEAPAIIDDMRTAYTGAVAFLRAEPAMPMPWLERAVAIGPVASLGTDRGHTLRDRLRLPDATHLGLVGLGGIPTQVPIADWPHRTAWHWLVPAAHHRPRPDMHAIESLDMPFSDLLASVDLVVTKPGYGTFVEAACLGKAVIYAERPDWPEEPGLSRWLETHTRAAGIPAAALLRGGFDDLPDMLLAASMPPRPAPAGNTQAAQIIATALLVGGPRTPASAGTAPAGTDLP